MLLSNRNLIGTLLSGMILTACTDEPKPVTPTIKPFEAQTQALEQAKQLENTVQDASEQRRQQIEAMTQ